MKRIEAKAVKAVEAIYSVSRMATVPVFFAPSPVSGAVMACILAHEKRINEAAGDRAARHATKLMFGKPSHSLIEKYRDVLTHTKKYGAGAHAHQPGDGAHRKITLGVMRGGYADDLANENRGPESLGLVRINRFDMLGMHAVYEQCRVSTRNRLHQLFQARVLYHPWIIKEQVGMGMVQGHALAWNNFWFPGKHFILWPNRRFAVLSAEPKRWRVNAMGMLHSERGSAAEWSDGWGITSLGGIMVPREFVDHPELITVEAMVGINNMEVRRALIERIGYENWLRQGRAKLLDQDLDGELRPRKLWALPGIDRLNVLQVVNSTPEPDGSYKPYFLTVPAHMVKCASAINWMLDDRLEHELVYRLES